MHLMTGFYGVLWFLRFDIDAAQGYLAARTKPLVPGDPVHANWHGTWYPGHVLEVRDDDVIFYWAEEHSISCTQSSEITRNSGGVPMHPKLTQIKMARFAVLPKLKTTGQQCKGIARVMGKCFVSFLS